MATTEERLASLETKFELFMQEIHEQREDIRRLQDRQDAAQAKHDAEMKEMNAKHATDMHEMNRRFYEKLDENYKDLTKQLHTNFIQTMIGVGAIMVAIGILIIAVLK